MSFPPEKLAQLAAEHQATVAICNENWNKLAQLHAKNPQFPAVDWTRLDAAFKLGRELGAKR